MSNQMIKHVFKNHQIRTFTDGKEIWFVANDVAVALGYENPREAVRTHCRYYRQASSVITQKDLLESLGIQGASNLLSEPDTYSLIMRSKMPSAEAFQDWVFEDVLPSIRKTGKYALPKRQLQLEIEQTSLAGFEAFQKMTYSEKIAVYCALQEQKSPMANYLVVDSYREPIYVSASAMSKKLGYKVVWSFLNDMVEAGMIDAEYHLPTDKGLRHGHYRDGRPVWCVTVADALRPIWDKHDAEMHMLANKARMGR